VPGRVPGETTELLRRGVTLLERRISVRVLMCHHRHQQHGREQQEELDSFQHVPSRMLVALKSITPRRPRLRDCGEKLATQRA